MAKIIVALDYPNAQEALSISKSFIKYIEWVKVGLELFTQEGPYVIKSLKDLGFKIMLDLKFFDIPNTIKKSVHSACSIGIDLITLHILGGENMIKAAVHEVASISQKEQNKPLLFGITVLTSMKQGELPGYSKSIPSLIFELSANAQSWGLDGVVCSGHEVPMIKSNNPSLLCLTPGIRMPKTQADDQERIMTPKEAVDAGSDFLVIGRPITQAKNPIEAVKIFTAMIS